MCEVQDSIFDLAVGQPSLALTPRSLLDEYIRRTISENTDPFIYQYTTAHGSLPFRKSLCRFLISSHLYGKHICPKNLLVTYGNSHGLALAISQLSRQGDSVIVEDPTYFLSGQLLRDNHLKVHACPIRDADGMDMDAFEKLVISHSPKLVYVNPVHQNPTGTCLSVARRERLLLLAKKYNFIILSDEPYIFLIFAGNDHCGEEHCSLWATAERMFGSAGSSQLVCLGSFSKILTPGLRCGWVHASDSIISRLSSNGALNSGGGPASILTETIRAITEEALEEHILILRVELANRCNSACEAVNDHLGGIVSFNRPSGGYFLYLRFNDSVDTVKLWEMSRGHGIPINFLPGSKCTALQDLSTANNRSCIRIAFSFYTSSELKQAIAILRTAYDAYTRNR